MKERVRERVKIETSSVHGYKKKLPEYNLYLWYHFII